MVFLDIPGNPWFVSRVTLSQGVMILLMLLFAFRTDRCSIKFINNIILHEMCIECFLGI